jgi:hypothetical protein
MAQPSDARPRALAAVRDANSASVELFARRARALSPTQWEMPRAPGKWAPFQEATHLILSYRLFERAVRGTYVFEPRLPEERMATLRETMVPRIITSDWFPSGAESIADAQPPATPAPREQLLPELEAALQAFADALAVAGDSNPERLIRHGFFGELPLRELGLVAAAHTRHHARFLPDVATATRD